jgi:membrane-associated protease RseP (regulator of RpoE activity)
MRARILDDDKVLRRPLTAALLVALSVLVWQTGSGGALVIFLGVSVSIGVHEGAHLLVARWCGARVSQYFVGFGPRLWQRDVRGTQVSLRLLPLVGGAVEIHPEDEPNVRHRSWLAIAVAGPLANLLFGWTLLFGAAIVADDLPLWEALPLSTDQTTETVSLTAGTITRLPDLVVSNIGAAAGGETPADDERLLSPVSMAQLGNGASEAGGFALLIRFVAVINIALGLMNLLPIPPLDGSLIAIHAVEGVADRAYGRPVKVPKLLFRSVAYGFTGVLLFAMGAAMLVDLAYPLRAFG